MNVFLFVCRNTDWFAGALKVKLRTRETNMGCGPSAPANRQAVVDIYYPAQFDRPPVTDCTHLLSNTVTAGVAGFEVGRVGLSQKGVSLLSKEGC